LAFLENGGLFVNSAGLHLKRASLREVKTMQKQGKEKRNEANESKENSKIQIVFFDRRKDYELEMRKWETKYRDTDGWLDKDYLIVKRIDESKFRQ
jgi:predicted Rossmann fold nucleotide-binding protein DprA/Smf involved in DNA uptake